MKLRLLLTVSLLTASLKSMEMANTTPLHEAAQSNDLYKCVQLLVQPTWLTPVIIQKAQFPTDALESMKASKDPMQNADAMRKMSLFTIKLNKLINLQAAHAMLQLTTINEEFLTPYDCAEKAQAQPDLLAILNPAGVHVLLMRGISNFFVEKLGAAGKIGIGVAPSNANPKEPLLKPGQTVEINGQKYTCDKATKIAETHEIE